jgi:hypothetical protein
MKLEGIHAINKRQISMAVMSMAMGSQPDVTAVNDANDCWVAVSRHGVYITTRRNPTTYCVPDTLVNQFVVGTPSNYATMKALIQAAAYVAQYAVKIDRGIHVRPLTVDCVYYPKEGKADG